MGKQKRSKLKKAARLAIAIHAYDLMEGVQPGDVGLSVEEHAIMQEEAMRIAIKLAGGHPMNLGSIKSCIDYFGNY